MAEQTPRKASASSVFKDPWFRATMKVWLAGAGIVSLGLGLGFSLLFLLDYDYLFQRLGLEALAARLFSGIQEESLLRAVAAGLTNLCLYIVGIAGAFFWAFVTALAQSRRGTFSPHYRRLLLLTHAPKSAGLVTIAGGAAVVVASVVLVAAHAALLLTWAYKVYPLVFSIGVGAVSLGLAMLITIVPLLGDPVQLGPEKPAPTPEPERKRLKGRLLLELLRRSPIYRRQDVGARTLEPVGKVDGVVTQWHGDDEIKKPGLELLLDRYPRLRGPIIEQTGIENLTARQTDALRAVLEADTSAAARDRDFVFVGWPGSGRTTLVNLLTLGAALHREGAMYCVTAESNTRNVTASTETRARTRHPSQQLRRWRDASGFKDTINIAEAYADREGSRLELGRKPPDVVFTDVRKLSDEVLQKATGDAQTLLRNLRYVVIDHPNRLPREELVRLRIALARLRLTAEMHGRHLTFIVVVPQLDNFEAFASWLLNNDEVHFQTFMSWFGPCELFGWLPPAELLSRKSKGPPVFARVPFRKEVEDLLVEIGFLAHQLESGEIDVDSLEAELGLESDHAAGTADSTADSDVLADDGPEDDGDSEPSVASEPGQHVRLRMCVVDSQPMLGPEVRDDIRTKVLQRLRPIGGGGRSTPAPAEISYFGTADIAIDRLDGYDVIVCVGIGSNPEHLVSALRAALAPEGAMILVGDSSPADFESMRLISSPFWDPSEHQDPSSASDLVAYPKIVLPDHSEAVIAHELASLFEDFKDRALPRERLQGVFPSDHTASLIERWEEQQAVESIQAFETMNEGMRPELRPYVRRVDTSFRGEQYEVYWGCCSRRVYRLYHDDSSSYSRQVGAGLVSYVDRDRLFIDFHPHTRLRFEPYTAEIVDRDDYTLDAKDKARARRRSIPHGEISFIYPDKSKVVEIDRRIPRFAVDLLDERPFRSITRFKPSTHKRAELLEDRIGSLFRLASPADLRPSAADEERAERRVQLAARLLRPIVAEGSVHPELQLVGGSWICSLDETMRDVMQTNDRLVEEPGMVQPEPLSPKLQDLMSRRFECVGLHLFVQLTRAGATSRRDQGGERPPAGIPWSSGLDVLRQFPAFHGLARCIRLYLERRYINIGLEYRVAVLPAEEHGAPAPVDPHVQQSLDVAPWRILVHRLREDEIREDRHLTDLLDRDELFHMLTWVRTRLEECDCEDGCSRCCGGMGTISQRMYDPDRVDAAWYDANRDLVSRAGAYLLACSLLDMPPDWQAYIRGMDDLLGWDDDAIPADAELQRLVAEVMGTPNTAYSNGVWSQRFKGLMTIAPGRLADAFWMKPTEKNAHLLGYYRPGERPKGNRVVVRGNRPRQEIKATLVHEFAHNWQFKVPEEFDLEQHHDSEEANLFFEGKLVTEGHARWADHAFRFLVGMRPIYSPKDPTGWDEYKTGYFLMDGIERAFGQFGLFQWLKYGSKAEGAPLRSRSKRLKKWPFSLSDALQAFDLYETAMTGTFSGIDIDPPVDDGDDPDEHGPGGDEP